MAGYDCVLLSNDMLIMHLHSWFFYKENHFARNRDIRKQTVLNVTILTFVKGTIAFTS